MRLIGREAVQAQPMNALIDKGSHSMTIITLLTQREQQTVRKGIFNKDSMITLKTLKQTI